MRITIAEFVAALQQLYLDHTITVREGDGGLEFGFTYIRDEDAFLHALREKQ